MSDEKKIEQSIEATVQSGVSGGDVTGGSVSRPMGLLFMLGSSSALVPPWWSTARDVYLRDIMTRSDHLAGALYNFSIKLRTIPLNIVARNESIKSHVSLAEAYEREIEVMSDFGQGFDSLFSKWIEDYHTQDNGAFLEIVAEGAKDGAIRGKVLSIAHLDAACCTRTGNAIYPVVYTDPGTGKSYKLHRTRVVASSQRPSPKHDMNGVGYCSVSSILNSAQSLIDNLTYKQERVGSRPAEAFIITGGGLDPDDVKTAIALQRVHDDNAQLQKYSSTVIAGSRNIQDPKFYIHRLNEMPEWFNEQESTIISMAVIAMGFGMDARELFPAMESGATKADAIISHIKQRGKGPGHVLRIMEYILDTYVLPSFLMARFDYQDDSEDRQRAEIRNVRAQARQRDLFIAITNERTERQLMLQNGEISSSQFEDLELDDGRLPSGVDVTILFESNDRDYVEWLGNVNESNWEEAKKTINKFLINSRDEEMIIKARRALAAINYRYDPPQKRFVGYENETQPRQQFGTRVGVEIGEGRSFDTDNSYQSERYGRKLPKQPITAEDETQRYQERNINE